MRIPACVVVLLLAACASSAEFPCSTPAEIAAAAKAAEPGDVLVLNDGTWTDADIRIEARGESGKPIVVRARTPGKVVLTGKSRLRFAGEHLEISGLRFEKCNGDKDTVEFRIDSNHHATKCRLTSCSFIDCSPANPATGSRYVSLYGSQNRVDHCFFAGKTNEGNTLTVWLVKDPVEHLIDNNHFGPRSRLGENGGETIRIGDSKTQDVPARCIVEKNLFEHCNGEVEIVSNKSCENIYRRNTFLECEGALTLRHGKRCTVEGNFFLGNSKKNTGGVRIVDAEHRVQNNYFADLSGEDTRAAICLMNGRKDSPPDGHVQVKNAIVESNTLVNCNQPIVIGYSYKGASLPPEGCLFAKNVVQGSAGPLVRLLTPPTNAKWVGNVMFGGETGLPAGTVTIADPKLVRGEDGVWRRPGEAADSHPLKPGDVGPEWKK